MSTDTHNTPAAHHEAPHGHAEHGPHPGETVMHERSKIRTKVHDAMGHARNDPWNADWKKEFPKPPLKPAAVALGLGALAVAPATTVVGGVALAGTAAIYNKTKGWPIIRTVDAAAKTVLKTGWEGVKSVVSAPFTMAAYLGKAGVEVGKRIVGPPARLLYKIYDATVVDTYHDALRLLGHLPHPHPSMGNTINPLARLAVGTGKTIGSILGGVRDVAVSIGHFAKDHYLLAGGATVLTIGGLANAGWQLGPFAQNFLAAAKHITNVGLKFLGGTPLP